jgi:hypothetical protein
MEGIKIWRDPFRFARLKGRESRVETSFQIITIDKGSRHLRRKTKKMKMKI